MKMRTGVRQFSSVSRLYSEGVKRLGVIGAGQMGLGIALVAAKNARVKVKLIDTSEKAIDSAMLFADKLLQKDISKQRLTREEASSILESIITSTKLEDCSDVDFVIEAAPEDYKVKSKIFSQLAKVCADKTILATNTSSISVTKIAAATMKDGRDVSVASRVISTHFMNPVPVQEGVEIIPGLQTSGETVNRAVEFCRAMGKIPSMSKDTPGFIANRILMPYINEAIICLETGIGSKEDIDNIMKKGTNVPMGPLKLADFIGLDTCLAIMQVLHDETGDSKYRASTLLKKMVYAGWLGKKSGKGFYEY